MWLPLGPPSGGLCSMPSMTSSPCCCFLQVPSLKFPHVDGWLYPPTCTLSTSVLRAFQGYGVDWLRQSNCSQMGVKPEAGWRVDQKCLEKCFSPTGGSETEILPVAGRNPVNTSRIEGEGTLGVTPHSTRKHQRPCGSRVFHQQSETYWSGRGYFKHSKCTN